MERTVIVESVSPGRDGQPEEATGTVEVSGIGARWSARRDGEPARWHARLVPGQFTTADDDGLVELLVEEPPLSVEVGREIDRLIVGDAWRTLPVAQK